MDYLIKPHARWRMNLRGISEEMIWETLHQPTQISYDNKGNFLFKKLYRSNNKSRVLVVAAEIVNNKLGVVTLFMSSKIRKYL